MDCKTERMESLKRCSQFHDSSPRTLTLRVYMKIRPSQRVYMKIWPSQRVYMRFWPSHSTSSIRHTEPYIQREYHDNGLEVLGLSVSCGPKVLWRFPGGCGGSNHGNWRQVGRGNIGQGIRGYLLMAAANEHLRSTRSSWRAARRSIARPRSRSRKKEPSLARETKKNNN